MYISCIIKMMKINNTDWNKIDLENIYDSILEISDIEDQKKRWNGKIPNIIASYDDVMLSLFDDYLFDNFVDDYVNEVELSMEFKEKIRLLREKLNFFDGYEMNHKRIFKHPQWIEISDISKEVIECWKISGLSYPSREINDV